MNDQRTSEAALFGFMLALAAFFLVALFTAGMSLREVIAVFWGLM